MDSIIDAENYQKREKTDVKQSEIIDADELQQKIEIKLGRIIVA